MKTPTQEQLEQLRNLRALIDHLEDGGGLEMNVGSYNNPNWAQRGLNVFLDQVAWYRAMPKPTSRFYTVEELIKAGARYVTTGGSVYTIVLLSPTTNSLTVMGTSPVVRAPEWFADTLCKWSANGQEWKSFMKED